MPITYTINPERKLITTRCTGNVTLPEVLQHFHDLGKDPSLPDRLDVFLDLSETTSLPTSGQIREVTRTIEGMNSTVAWGTCAILSTRDALFGMSRVFETFLEGIFENARVFRHRENAEKWLEEKSGILP